MIETMPTTTYALQDRDRLTSDSDGYVLRFKDLPDLEKPRERLLELGPAYLSVAELVAVIWNVGNKNEDVLAMARRTVKEYGDTALGNERNPRHISTVTDIPLGKACQLVAAVELGRRFQARRAGKPVQVRNASQAYQYLQDMGQGRKEQLRGLYLDSQYHVIYDEVISVGSLTANIVHPREVFRPAVEHGAVAVIIAHNHPSGRLEPTAVDLDITQQLIEAAGVLGIDLLDHLIITNRNFKSILELAAEP